VHVRAGAYNWTLKNTAAMNCFATHGILPDQHISTLPGSCLKVLLGMLRQVLFSPTA